MLRRDVAAGDEEDWPGGKGGVINVGYNRVGIEGGVVGWGVGGERGQRVDGGDIFVEKEERGEDEEGI